MEAGRAVPVTHDRPCIDDHFLLSHCEDLKNPTIGTKVFVSKTLLGWLIPKGLEPERAGGRQNKVEMKWKSLMLGK